MRSVSCATDSVFAVKTDLLSRTAARGEAVDFDKYDSDGKLNPHHGWTLDFPEHIPSSERTYGNKDKAQGWYDDPENEPLARGTRWGGTGDYADRTFYEHTNPYSQATDPNREAVDSTGVLGQYPIGDEDLNEYQEYGHVPSTDQTGYPESSGWDVRPSTEHDHEMDHENHGDDTEEDQGSHLVQQRLVNAGFERRPDEFNGDRYVSTDYNGHRHVVRAPNPSYGAMDTWHYEFSPSNEWHVSNPYAPSDTSREGPRSLSFSARNSDEAHNLHKNLGNDLSELSSRGWGFHEVRPENARMDVSMNPNGSGHLIEAHRRSATDQGYDRLIKGPQGWAVHHIPDPTSENGFPHVLSVAQGRSRKNVLDVADRHDARTFLNAHGSHHDVDEASGAETWQVLGRRPGTDYYNVQIPGEDGPSRWHVTHNSTDRGIINHTSHPNWPGARDELMGRI